MQAPDDLSLQKLPFEFVRRGKEAIARSEAAGDGVRAEVVLARLRARVEEARQRRKVGLLKGPVDAPVEIDDALPSNMLEDFEIGATKASKLTVIDRVQNDPDFAFALIEEAIELARNGERELAKRILSNLVEAGTAGQMSNLEFGQAAEEENTGPRFGADEPHRSEE